MKYTTLFIAFWVLFISCAQKKENDVPLVDLPVEYQLQTHISGIEIPWGMTWLPDGSMLITERSGILYHYKNNQLQEITHHLSDLYVRGQGGLLDIATHPQYDQNGWIYLTYSSSDGAGSGGNTKLIRARLLNNELIDIQTLYKAQPNTTRGQHFGSRIVFDRDGYLYFTIGDRGDENQNPQDLSKDGGKVYRLHDDGQIPNDNPFVTNNLALPAIYTYGHRNPQGMTLHPETGEIWLHEHGPQGGDEINVLQPGANYGWPEITYGINYDGSKISTLTEKSGMQQPLYYWTPSIAPSGMVFITSDQYPGWKNHLLVGALKFRYLELLKIKNNQVIERHKIAEDIGRLRDVKQGPDGLIYIAVEGQGIVKIIPK